VSLATVAMPNLPPPIFDSCIKLHVHGNDMLLQKTANLRKNLYITARKCTIL